MRSTILHASIAEDDAVLNARQEIGVAGWGRACIDWDTLALQLASEYPLQFAVGADDPLMVCSGIDGRAIGKDDLPEALIPITLEERLAVDAAFAQDFMLTAEATDRHDTLASMHRGVALEAVVVGDLEAGARAGMVAPDETTYAYMEGRPHAPQGADWDAAVEYWNTLRTDEDAVFDAQVDLDADTLEPFVTWGTNPGQGVSLSESVPSPEDFGDENAKAAAERALQYMGLEAGTPMKEIRVDTVFLGSCTNSRMEDLRAAADIIRGRQKAPNVRMLVVPGSARVRLEAEAEGLDRVFKDFGAEWRFAGCSMCLGMNPDQLEVGERCASTSNRNFEGRQGKGGRTHLVSPVVAAATAIRGTLSSPSDLDPAPESAAIRTDAA